MRSVLAATCIPGPTASRQNALGSATGAWGWGVGV